MPAEQKEIYYLIGETREQLRALAVPGGVPGKGQDVLLLTDPIDEFAIPSLRRVQGQAAQGRRPRRRDGRRRGRRRT